MNKLNLCDLRNFFLLEFLIIYGISVDHQLVLYSDDELPARMAEKCSALSDYSDNIHCQLRFRKKHAILKAIYLELHDLKELSPIRANLERGNSTEITFLNDVIKNKRKKRELILDTVSSPKREIKDDELESEIIKVQNKNNISYENREPETKINSITIRAISKGSSGRIWFDNTEILKYVFKSSIILFFIGDIRIKYPNHYYSFNILNYISGNEIDSQFSINETTSTVDLNWRQFDTSELLRKWQKHPEKNFGISIQITVIDKSGTEVFKENLLKNEDGKPVKAYLEVREAFKHRHKRHINLVLGSLKQKIYKTNCKEVGGKIENNYCCVHPLLVNFADMGMDFIISPSEVYVNYCFGICKKEDQQASTNPQNLFFTHLNQLCCSAYHLNSLTILFLDTNGTAHKRELENLLIDNCICN